MKTLDITQFNKRGKSLLFAIEHVMSQVEGDKPGEILMTKTQFSKMKGAHYLQEMYASNGENYMLLTSYGVLEVRTKQ